MTQSDKLDLATIGRIRDEGFNRSQVMDHIFWLADVHGPRLTGSPAPPRKALPTPQKRTTEQNP